MNTLATQSLIFNFQSLDANNISVPLSNRGSNIFSTPIQATSTNINTNANRYHYVHNSSISVIAWYWWGDFALCKINTPIPPHFNYSFSGWTPSLFAFNTFSSPASNFVNFHHPRGDVKKVSSSSFVTGPRANYGCRTLTKVVDFLFGWIWGRKWSTEVICTYTEVPWAYIPIWNFGISEGGSSGSGLFKSTDLIGILSGSISSCSFPSSTTFGMFRNNYYQQAVKNILNPDNQFWVDQMGIRGRTITCHQNLNNLSGEYFAASAYQANNRITLQSATTVTTNGTLRVHPGADYSLVASQSITLGPGFEVVRPQPGETGGIFEARTASCVVPRSDEKSNDIPSDVMRKARNLELPQYKPFNPQQFLNKDNGLVDLDAQSEIQAYPNPSSDGNFTVRFVVDAKKSVNLAFTDILGKTIYTTKYSCIQGENYFPLDMSGKGIAEGMYFITVDDGVSKKVKKVVIK
jgi:hypothetical protein